LICSITTAPLMICGWETGELCGLLKRKLHICFPSPTGPRSKQLPHRTNRKPPRSEEVQLSHQNSTPVRRYEVVALQTDIVYNAKGDHDPFGIVFALRKDEKAIRSGTLNPEPLIIRANVGDWVEITLHNRLPNRGRQEHGHPHGYPAVPVEVDVHPSSLISLHPQLLVYDVGCSDGTTVGYNPDQTVEPGKSITYRWYVDREVGVCNLWDMADLRNHRHHGAFGVLITEAKGSRYLHPETRKEIRTGSQAIISHPFLGEFREFVMIMHDGVRLVDKNGNLIIDPVVPSIPLNDLTDFEDQGSRGFNYRLERLSYRLEQNPDVSKAFSSEYHGDPATPLFLANPGDPVTVRLVCPADRARSHSFIIHGHSWLRYKDDLYSTHESVSGQNIVGSHANFQLKNGAGGLFLTPGDYLYRSGNIRWDIELGMWGIIRVLNEPGKIAPLTNDKGVQHGSRPTKTYPMS
jgi:manganese oxidase